MANHATQSNSQHRKARRFTIVSNNLPIEFVVHTLDALLRPSTYELQPGERLPISRYATILHTEKGDTHVLIETVNPVRFSTVKNWFAPYGVIIEQVSGARRGWCRMLRYLTHEATSDKRMYADADVHVSAGFNWLGDIEWLEAREHGAPALVDRVKRRIFEGKTHVSIERERHPELFLNPKFTHQLETLQKTADKRHEDLHASCGYDGEVGDYFCQVHGKPKRRDAVTSQSACKATPTQRYEGLIRQPNGLTKLASRKSR